MAARAVRLCLLLLLLLPVTTLSHHYHYQQQPVTTLSRHYQQQLQQPLPHFRDRVRATADIQAPFNRFPRHESSLRGSSSSSQSHSNLKGERKRKSQSKISSSSSSSSSNSATAPHIGLSFHPRALAASVADAGADLLSGAFSEVVLPAAGAAVIGGSETLGENISGEGLSMLFLHSSAAIASISSSGGGGGGGLPDAVLEWLGIPRGKGNKDAAGSRTAENDRQLLVLDCTGRLLPCPQLSTCQAVSLIDFVQSLIAERRGGGDSGSASGNRSSGSGVDGSDHAARLAVENVNACGSPGFTPTRMRASGSATSGQKGNPLVPESGGWEHVSSPYDDTPLISRLSSANLLSSCPPTAEDPDIWLTATRVVPTHCPARLLQIGNDYCRGRSTCSDFLSLPEFRSAWEGTAGEGAISGGKVEDSEEREWVLEVFVISDVFLDRWGRVFNGTHLFHTGRCSDSTEELNYPSTTKVILIDELFNLIADSNDASYSEIVQKLPVFLPLLPFTHDLMRVPILVSDRERDSHLFSHFAGLPLSGPTATRLYGDQLLRVKRLYMPLFEPCGAPSPSLLHALRSHHLLTPQGLPVLPTTPSPTPPPPLPPPIFPNSSSPLAAASWHVVIAGPLPAMAAADSGRFLALSAASAAARKLLEKVFGQGRVVVYKPAPLAETRALFNQALLFVACDHSLANMLFLPYLAAVLELRYYSPLPLPPSSPHSPPLSPFPSNGSLLYRDLAAASGIKHFAVECNIHAPKPGDPPPASEPDTLQAGDTPLPITPLPGVTNPSAPPPLPLSPDLPPPPAPPPPPLSPPQLSQPPVSDVTAPQPVSTPPSLSTPPNSLQSPPPSNSTSPSRALPAMRRLQAHSSQHSHVLAPDALQSTASADSSASESIDDRLSARGTRRTLLSTAASEAAGNLPEDDWQAVGEQLLRKGDDYLTALFGGENKIYIALEGIAASLLASDAFLPNLLARSSNGFENRIPGSKIRTAGQLSKLREWARCVGERGRWVREEAPRKLPWQEQQSQCDARQVQAGGIAGEEAEAVATEWLSYASSQNLQAQHKAEAAWKVRDSVKYVWDDKRQCGQWEKFDTARLCSLATEKRVGQQGKEGGKSERSFNVLIVGDSLQDLFFKSLVANIASFSPSDLPIHTNVTIPEECALAPLKDAGVCTCSETSFNAVVTTGAGNRNSSGSGSGSSSSTNDCTNTTLRVTYVRNFFLFLSSHHVSKNYLPWARMTSLFAPADVILVNQGAHGGPPVTFRAGIRAALRHIRNHAPEKLIIFRNTPPGHANCMDYKGPIEKKQEEEILPYNWGLMPEYNEIAREEAAAVGAAYLDVYSMTVLRPDGHRSDEDCLHYCMPGPIDTWVQACMNLMLQLQS